MSRPTDSSAFRSRMERDLILGGLVIGVVVGGGLIYLIWGDAAVATSAAIFGLFLVLIIVVWIVLKLIAWLGGPED